MGHNKVAIEGAVYPENRARIEAKGGRNKYSDHLPQRSTSYSVDGPANEIEVLCADSSDIANINCAPPSPPSLPTHRDPHTPSSHHACTNLTIYFQNVRGLRSKLVSLRQSLSITKFKIFSLTATWLNSAFSFSELGFINFDIFRKDRN